MPRYNVYAHETVAFMKTIEADSMEDAERIVEEAEENAELFEFFGSPIDGDGIRVEEIQLVE